MKNEIFLRPSEYQYANKKRHYGRNQAKKMRPHSGQTAIQNNIPHVPDEVIHGIALQNKHESFRDNNLWIKERCQIGPECQKYTVEELDIPKINHKRGKQQGHPKAK